MQGHSWEICALARTLNLSMMKKYWNSLTAVGLQPIEPNSPVTTLNPLEAAQESSCIHCISDRFMHCLVSFHCPVAPKVFARLCWLMHSLLVSGGSFFACSY